METLVHPRRSSDSGMALPEIQCSLLYLYSEPGLYIPASATISLVLDFYFGVISTTPIIKASQKGEKFKEK